jgi:hypothetical protein
VARTFACPPFHLVDPGSVFFVPLVGRAVEVFRFGRIVFGSAPSLVSHARTNAGDWYEIAREAFVEPGVDQENV